MLEQGSSIFSDLTLAFAASCIVWLSSRRKMQLLKKSLNPLILVYGWKSRAVVVLSWLIIVFIKAYFGQNFPPTTAGDYIFVVGISVLYFLQTLFVFNHSVIVSEDTVRTVSTWSQMSVVQLKQLGGARESSTKYFGGVTTFVSGAQKVKIRHQLVNYLRALSIIRSAVRAGR